MSVKTAHEILGYVIKREKEGKTTTLRDVVEYYSSHIF